MLNLTDLVRRCSNLAGAQLLSKRYEGGHLRAPQQKGDRLVSGEIGMSGRGGNKPTNSHQKQTIEFSRKTSPQAKRHKPSLLITSLTILTSLTFITR